MKNFKLREGKYVGVYLMMIACMLLIVIPAAARGEYEEESLQVAALKGPTALGMIQMMESAPSLGKGVSPEFSIVNNPTLMVSKVVNGDVDIAALPTNLAAVLHSKGVSYKLGAIVGYGLLYGISSRDDIQSWEDLKGQRVYNIARGSTPDYLFSYLCQENGIDPEEDLTVDFSYSHQELAPLLIAGKVDTGVLPEPLITKVLLSNPEMKVILDFQEEWSRLQKSEKPYPISCIIVSEAAWQRMPEEIQSFFEAYEESIGWVNDNPAEAGALANTHQLGFTSEVVESAMGRLNLEFDTPRDARQELNQFYQVLYQWDPKSVGGKVPHDEFYLDY